MTAVVWPGNVLPARVMFHPDIPSASGGPSSTGAEQDVFSSAGRWRARMSFNVRRQFGSNPRARILAARAMLAHMDGKSNTVYIGPYDESNAPSALVLGGTQGLITGIPFSDGALFSDGSGFAQFATPVELDGAALEGAMTLDVQMINPDHVAQAGQYFGFGQAELYLIKSSVDNGSGSFTLRFRPPLRADHADGEVVNFDTPTCEMKFASDATGELDFSAGFAAGQTLEFVEAL